MNVNKKWLKEENGNRIAPKTLTSCIQDENGNSFQEYADKMYNIIADAYDETKTYAIGDYCIYNNMLYKCITAITTAEEFVSAKWKQTNITNLISSFLVTEDISSTFFDPDYVNENVDITEFKASKFLNHISFYVRLTTKVDLNSSMSLFKVNSLYSPFMNNNIFSFNDGEQPFSPNTQNSIWNTGDLFKNWGGILPADSYYVVGSYLCK